MKKMINNGFSNRRISWLHSLTMRLLVDKNGADCSEARLRFVVVVRDTLDETRFPPSSATRRTHVMWITRWPRSLTENPRKIIHRKQTQMSRVISLMSLPSVLVNVELESGDLFLLTFQIFKSSLALLRNISDMTNGFGDLSDLISWIRHDSRVASTGSPAKLNEATRSKVKESSRVRFQLRILKLIFVWAEVKLLTIQVFALSGSQDVESIFYEDSDSFRKLPRRSSTSHRIPTLSKLSLIRKRQHLENFTCNYGYSTPAFAHVFRRGKFKSENYSYRNLQCSCCDREKWKKIKIMMNEFFYLISLSTFPPSSKRLNPFLPPTQLPLSAEEIKIKC